jgi:hypothetical protein
MIKVYDIYDNVFPATQWPDDFDKAVMQAKKARIKWVSYVVECDDDTGEILRQKKIPCRGIQQ